MEQYIYMPVEYTIDKGRKLIVSRAWGVLTDADVLGHQRDLNADSDFQPGLFQLYDASEAVDIEVSPGVIRSLAQNTPAFGSGSRRALVVASEVGFGLARMFEMLTDPLGENVRVFRKVEEARRWLGLE